MRGEASRIKEERRDWRTYLADSFLNAVYSRHCCDADTKSRETIITLRRLLDRKNVQQRNGRAGDPPPIAPSLLPPSTTTVPCRRFALSLAEQPEWVRVCVLSSVACMRSCHCVRFIHLRIRLFFSDYSSPATAAAAAATPFFCSASDAIL